MSNQNTLLKIVIHCQYVYGIGHLVRANELGRALSEAFEVYILNGGEKVENFKLCEAITYIQLPAIYKEENEPTLTPVDPSTDLAVCLALRKQIIDQSINDICPDIVITEHFPFGLLFEAEVMALITLAKRLNPKVQTVSSVRDVIESSLGGKRDAYSCELLNNFFDLVLVHGDKDFLPLSSSFPQLEKISIPIVHTGYVVRKVRNNPIDGTHPVILASVAGGRLGNELLDAVIECHSLVSSKLKHKLVLFSGAFQKDYAQQLNKVYSLVSPDVILEQFDGIKYLKWLSKASIVISLGGYNSIIESVSANKTLLVYNRKFSGGNEEQDIRIKLLERLKLLTIISPDDLSIQKLSTLILQKNLEPNISSFELNAQGAENSCKILVDLLLEKNKYQNTNQHV